MKFRRMLSLTLALMLLLTLAACGQKQPPASSQSLSSLSESAPDAPVGITGTVTLEGPESATQGPITLEGDAPNATEAFLAFCKAQGITYDYKEGFFSGFGGIASTATDGWLLYVDGELAQVGADDIALADGFDLAFRWANYDKAFAG